MQIRLVHIGILGFVIAANMASPIVLSADAQSAAQSLPSTSSTAPRIVVTGHADSANPVGVIVVLYDGKALVPRKPFDAPDDWLKHLTISIRNRSSKPLIAGTLQLAFPGIGGDPMVVQYVRTGMTPEHQLYTSSGVKITRPSNEAPVSVAPGAAVEFAISKYYGELQAKLTPRVPMSQVTSVTIDYGAFYFAGGYRWQLNSFRKEDSAKPGNYVGADPKDILATPSN